MKVEKTMTCDWAHASGTCCYHKDKPRLHQSDNCCLYGNPNKKEEHEKSISYDDMVKLYMNFEKG